MLIDARARLGGLVAVALGTVITMVEIVGAGIIVLALELSADGRAPTVPVLGDLADLLPGSTPREDLVWLAGIGVGFFIARAAITLFQLYAVYRVAYGLGARLAGRVAAGALRRPFAWHLSTNSTDLSNAIVVVSQQFVIGVFAPLLTTASQILVLVGLIGLALVAEPVAATLTAAGLGATVVVALRLTRRRLLVLGRAEVKMNAESFRTITEALRSIRDVKISEIESVVLSELRDSRDRWTRALRRRSLLVASPRVLIETTSLCLLLVFLAARASQEAVTSLGLLGYVVIRVLPTVNSIIQNANMMRGNYGAAEALIDLIDHGDQSEEEEEGVLDRPPIGSTPVIELDGVSFGFTRQNVVHDIHLRIPPGTSLGIVGSTGSGKSTLVNLMIGLLEPTGGQVRVDDKKLSTVRRTWWRHISVVPQEISLFDNSLRSNIALGVPEDEIDEQRMANALWGAHLDREVNTMPDGLATQVGEGGMRLSGGQRQRVALARALYREPAVVFLDEATSALDAYTERRVIERITSGGQGRTVIMIAHRTQTLRSCDQVIRIENGRITAHGSFEQLFPDETGHRRTE